MNPLTPDDAPQMPAQRLAKKARIDQTAQATPGDGDPAVLGKSINTMFSGLGDSTTGGFPVDMSMSTDPNLFSMSASSSDFWKMLEPDEMGEMHQQSQNAEFRHRLLLKNLEEEPPTSIKMENIEYVPGLPTSNLHPMALYGSQPGNNLGFSAGALLREVVGDSAQLPEEIEEREDEEYGVGSPLLPPESPFAVPAHLIKSEMAPATHFDIDQQMQQRFSAQPQFMPGTPTTPTTPTMQGPPTPTSTGQPPKPPTRKRGRAPKQQQNQSHPQTPPPQQPPQMSQQQQQFFMQMQQQLQRTSPSVMITQLSNLEKSVDNQLKAIRFAQRKVIDAFNANDVNREEVEKLIRTHGEIRKQIDTATMQLEHINGNVILAAADAWNLIRLLETFQFHAKRLGVLQEEYYMVQANPSRVPDPVALLVITKQPFPCTVKQSKSVDDTVEVQVITGARVDIQGPSIVQAELINEDYNPIMKKKNSAPAIQNGEEPLDENGVAAFRRLTFPHGSRVKSVNMRFGVDLNLSGQQLRLQSEPSRPFIVMTNHGQRSTTEGKLLKKHIFARNEIEWPAFANAMQLHYLRATKQEPLKPTRPLSLKDLEYLHITKFSGRPYVSQEDYDSFWAWFGTILYKIRNHQKHILPMWIKGLIYGFLSREDSDRLLQTQAAIPGSFLVRFSDRCAGQFVVVYVSQGKKEDPNGREVKHYLVRPEDIEKKSTLPDFLRECENLWYLLQVVRDPESGVISLRPRNKDEVMAPYYTRERSQPLPYGYDTRQP